jgi:hypothetical protein
MQSATCILRLGGKFPWIMAVLKLLEDNEQLRKEVAPRSPTKG